MEITEYLIGQHDDMRSLIEDFDQTEPASARAETARQIYHLWTDHGEAEEQTLYARMRSSDAGAEDEVKEGIAEHDNGKVLFEELLAMEPSDPMFRARFGAISEVVEHHLDEEEEDLFEDAREHLPLDEREELAQSFENKFRTQQLKRETVGALRDRARDLDIASASSLTKDELIAAIQGAIHAKG